MQYDDSIAASVAQLLYSDCKNKCACISDLLDLQPSDRQLLTILMQERQTFASLWEIVRNMLDIREKNFHIMFCSLPTPIKTHIMHLCYNRCIEISKIKNLSINVNEDLSAVEKSAFLQLNPDYSYILLRIPPDFEVTLNSVTFFSRNTASDMKKSYAKHALECNASQSIWFRKDSLLLSYEYAGMGHYHVISSAIIDGELKFFKFMEGGANGCDRDDNFHNASILTRNDINILPSCVYDR